VRFQIQPRDAGVPADLGAPRLPGCKSHAQRALLLAAFSAGERLLRGVPDGDDVACLERVLRSWGRDVQARGDERRVTGAPLRPGQQLQAHVGENGTAARTLLMLVPLLGGCLQLDGAPGLRRRPFGAAVRALRALGVACSSDELPLQADGSAGLSTAARSWRVDAAVSTQPATGALLALALGGGGELVANAPRAGGYLHLTAAVLRAFGLVVEEQHDAGASCFTVAGTAPPAGEYAVPPDASARAFVAALAAMHGVHPPAGLDAFHFGSHPDLQIDEDLRCLFANADRDVQLRGLGARPDCVPVLAAAAATRPGTTRLCDLPNLRHKESDRLAAMAAGLTAAGARATTEGDDLVVEGPLRDGAEAAHLPTAADHRVVMALALLGTVRRGGVIVDHGAAVAKSWPGFFDWLARCADVRQLL